MNSASKVLWGEGLFLRPQHFQQQDAHHEWRVAQAVSSLHPYAYGVRTVDLDVAALSASKLQLNAIDVVFESGEAYAASRNDELPEGLSLHDLAATNSLIVRLTLPNMRAGGNFAMSRSEASPEQRYYKVQSEFIDQFTEAAPARLETLSKSVRLSVGEAPAGSVESLPLLKIKRAPSGGFELDKDFMPPSLTIASSALAFTRLTQMLDILQAKVSALYGFHREPSKNIIQFRSGDVASFWLLHTASSAHASLTHLMKHPKLHPERLFQRLLELAGALMTFSKDTALGELPVYAHDEPAVGWLELDRTIRKLLETVISTRYFAIALEERPPTFHRGALDADNIGPSSRLYLAVTASMPAAELIMTVPSRFKVGGSEDVDKLVLSAMPGVAVTHVAQVPGEIPVMPGSLYFAIEPRGEMYERMLQSQSATIYVPGGMTDLKLQLMAINP